MTGVSQIFTVCLAYLGFFNFASCQTIDVIDFALDFDEGSGEVSNTEMSGASFSTALSRSERPEYSQKASIAGAWSASVSSSTAAMSEYSPSIYKSKSLFLQEEATPSQLTFSTPIYGVSSSTEDGEEYFESFATSTPTTIAFHTGPTPISRGSRSSMENYEVVPSSILSTNLYTYSRTPASVDNFSDALSTENQSDFPGSNTLSGIQTQFLFESAFQTPQTATPDFIGKTTVLGQPKDNLSNSPTPTSTWSLITSFPLDSPLSPTQVLMSSDESRSQILFPTTSSQSSIYLRTVADTIDISGPISTDWFPSTLREAEPHGLTTVETELSTFETEFKQTRSSILSTADDSESELASHSDEAVFSTSLPSLGFTVEGSEWPDLTPAFSLETFSPSISLYQSEASISSTVSMAIRITPTLSTNHKNIATALESGSSMGDTSLRTVTHSLPLLGPSGTDQASHVDETPHTPLQYLTGGLHLEPSISDELILSSSDIPYSPVTSLYASYQPSPRFSIYSSHLIPEETSDTGEQLQSLVPPSTRSIDWHSNGTGVFTVSSGSISNFPWISLDVTHQPESSLTTRSLRSDKTSRVEELEHTTSTDQPAGRVTSRPMFGASIISDDINLYPSSTTEEMLFEPTYTLPLIYSLSQTTSSVGESVQTSTQSQSFGLMIFSTADDVILEPSQSLSISYGFSIAASTLNEFEQTSSLSQSLGLLFTETLLHSSSAPSSSIISDINMPSAYTVQQSDGSTATLGIESVYISDTDRLSVTSVDQFLKNSSVTEVSIVSVTSGNTVAVFTPAIAISTTTADIAVADISPTNAISTTTFETTADITPTLPISAATASTMVAEITAIKTISTLTASTTLAYITHTPDILTTTTTADITAISTITADTTVADITHSTAISTITAYTTVTDIAPSTTISTITASTMVANITLATATSTITAYTTVTDLAPSTAISTTKASTMVANITPTRVISTTQTMRTKYTSVTQAITVNTTPIPVVIALADVTFVFSFTVDEPCSTLRQVPYSREFKKILARVLLYVTRLKKQSGNTVRIGEAQCNSGPPLVSVRFYNIDEKAVVQALNSSHPFYGVNQKQFTEPIDLRFSAQSKAFKVRITGFEITKNSGQGKSKGSVLGLSTAVIATAACLCVILICVGSCVFLREIYLKRRADCLEMSGKPSPMLSFKMKTKTADLTHTSGVYSGYKTGLDNLALSVYNDVEMTEVHLGDTEEDDSSFYYNPYDVEYSSIGNNFSMEFDAIGTSGNLHGVMNSAFSLSSLEDVTENNARNGGYVKTRDVGTETSEGTTKPQPPVRNYGLVIGLLGYTKQVTEQGRVQSTNSQGQTAHKIQENLQKIPKTNLPDERLELKENIYSVPNKYPRKKAKKRPSLNNMASTPPPIPAERSRRSGPQRERTESSTPAQAQAAKKTSPVPPPRRQKESAARPKQGQRSSQRGSADRVQRSLSQQSTEPRQGQVNDSFVGDERYAAISGSTLSFHF